MDDIKVMNPAKKNNSGRIFWTAVAVLVLLLLISLVVLSVRLYVYSAADNRAVSLKSNMDTKLDVFSVEYKSASGEVSVSGTNGEKVIAPGTDVEYTIRIRNTDTVAIDYDLVPTVTLLSDHKLPIVVRLLDPEDNYLVGDAKTWVEPEVMNTINEKATLGKGEAVEYLFQWKWPFESGDDAYDTFLGDTTITEKIGIQVSFSIHAESNTTLEDNGGFFGSGAHENMIMLIFCLLIALTIVLLIVFRKIHTDLSPDPIAVAGEIVAGAEATTPAETNGDGAAEESVSDNADDAPKE